MLGANQYGKAECRLVRSTATPTRHQIEDLNVTSQLRGDFEAAHTEGDNSQVVATDTQKNTVYAFARDGIGSPEEFLLAPRSALRRRVRVGRRWPLGGRAVHLGADRSTGAARPRLRPRAARHAPPWSSSTATQVVTCVSGLEGLHGAEVDRARSSTASRRDRYTTLQETTDRILATSVTARWRYTSTDIDFNGVYADDPRRSCSRPSRTSTRSPCSRRSSRWARRVLRARPEVGRDQALAAQQAPLPGRLRAVRVGQPGRGLLRRRPSLRPDRGHRPARGSLMRIDAVQAQRVLVDGAFRPATVLVHGGRIAAIEPVDHEVDGVVLRAPETAYVVPGVVDTHVHINEPGRTEWEGFVSATEAAAWAVRRRSSTCRSTRSRRPRRSSICRLKQEAADGRADGRRRLLGRRRAGQPGRPRTAVGGRGLRVQVLPRAERVDDVSAARPRPVLRRAARDRPLRRADDRARRGRAPSSRPRRRHRAGPIATSCSPARHGRAGRMEQVLGGARETGARVPHPAPVQRHVPST